MNEKIVTQEINSNGNAESGATIGGFLSVIGFISLILLSLWQSDTELLGLDVLWVGVFGAMVLGGTVAVVLLSVYIVPRFGLVALPVGLGLAIVDVFVVLPRTFLFVAERFIVPMQLAAYPDILPALLAWTGVTAVAGPIVLLAVGFMTQGVTRG